ncbi:MAG: hypothetical protein ABSH12_09560, partial [Endomicrobiales bacterium]
MKQLCRAYYLNNQFKPFCKKWLNRISLFGTVLIMMVAILGSIADTACAAMNSNSNTTAGLMTYSGSEDTPQYRQLQGNTYGPETGAVNTGGTDVAQKGPFLSVVVKAAPSWMANINPARVGEKIMVTLDTNGRLAAQVWTPGSGWGNETVLLAIPDSWQDTDFQRGVCQPFDVAYSSYEAIVVAANYDDTTAANNLIMWRWNGSNWDNSPITGFGTGVANGVKWLRMESNPVYANAVFPALATFDSGERIEVRVGFDVTNGSPANAWGASWETPVQAYANAAYESFDIAFEQQSGVLRLFQSDTAARQTPQYYTWLGGNTWTTGATIVTLNQGANATFNGIFRAVPQPNVASFWGSQLAPNFDGSTVYGDLSGYANVVSSNAFRWGLATWMCPASIGSQQGLYYEQKIPWAASFNGTSSFGDLASFANIVSSNSYRWAMSAWICPTTIGSAQTLFYEDKSPPAASFNGASSYGDLSEYANIV